MKFLLCELNKRGGDHVPFNASLVKLFEDSFSYVQIDFIGESSHIEGIKNFIDSFQKTVFHEIQSYQILKIFFNKKEFDTILFTSVSLVQLIQIRMFNLLKKRNIFIVSHGEVEKIDSRKKGKSIKSIVYRNIFSYIYFNFLYEKTNFIFLGHSIKSSLDILIPEKIYNSKSFLHPFYFKNENESSKQESKRIYNLGLIGNSAVSKGSNNLLNLIPHLNDAKFNIFAIGRIQDNLYDKFKKNNVKVIGSPFTLLPRNVYDSAISELDFILFFYPKNTYKYIASGAIFDAILFGKPIIALENPFFQEVFEEVGPLGYLCEDINEMAIKINEINEEDYFRFKSNIEKFKIKHNSITISKTFLNL